MAISFSPTKLEFNIEKNQEVCNNLTISSDSPTLSVYDVWADNRDVEWEVTNFEESAETHGITISYPKTLSDPENSVVVCISGIKEGEYHGAIIFREKQEGNSITQAAIWLSVSVGEEASFGSESVSGGTSGDSNNNPNKKIDSVIEEDGEIIEETVKEGNTVEEQTENQIEEITASVVEEKYEDNDKKGYFIPVLLLIVIIILILSIIYWRKRK